MNPRLIITIGLLLRIAVAVWNGFFGPSLGAELDADSFYSEALAGSQSLLFLPWEQGPYFYINFLMLCFSLFGSSLFFGSLISCFAWLAAAILLLKALRTLDLEDNWRAIPLWIFALAPASVLNTAVTLREPFQLLFVNLAIYAGLRLALTRKPIYWLPFVIGAVGGGLLHGALAGFAFILVPATLLLIFAVKRQGLPWGRILLAVLAGVIVIDIASAYLSYHGRDFSEGLLAAAIQYQEGALGTDARANYRIIDYDFSGFGAIRTVVVSQFQYQLEPLPGNISSLADIGLFFENLVRLWLIYLAARNIHRSSGAAQMALMYCLAMFLALELIWSLGTVNWGTAARHHVPAMGLLVLAAGLAVRRKERKGDAQDRPANVPLGVST